MAAPEVDDWVKAFDKQRQRAYWHSHSRQKSVWTDPAKDVSSDRPVAALSVVEHAEHTDRKKEPSSVSANDNAASDWKECVTPEGHKYFFSRSLRRSLWKDPRAKPAHRDVALDSEDDWRKCTSPGGHVYFYSRSRNRSVWADPHSVVDSSASSAASKKSRSLSSRAADDWQERISPNGRRFYYSKSRKQSMWTDPREGLLSSSDWKEFKDAEGRAYYHSASRGESAWVLPGSGHTLAKPAHRKVHSEDDETSTLGEWRQFIDSATQRFYWYNAARRESRWTPPSMASRSVDASGRGNLDGRAESAEVAVKAFAATLKTCKAAAEHFITSRVEAGDQFEFFAAEPAGSNGAVYETGAKLNGGEQLGVSDIGLWSRRGSGSSSGSSKHVSIDSARLSNLQTVGGLGGIGGDRRRALTSDLFEKFRAPEARDSFVYGGALYKRGGGTTRFFGNNKWKARYVVIERQHLGIYKSEKDYQASKPPIKNRWVKLDEYRLEEMLQDELGFRLIPAEKMTTEQRQWIFKADTQAHKNEWVRAFLVVVTGQGFLKGLSDRLENFKSSRPDLLLDDDTG